jgi:endonuclease/exonuclease/phosphatase family metal-dependent hydrolase
MPNSKRALSLALLLTGAVSLASCAGTVNFPDPGGPRFADCCVSPLPDSANATARPAGELRVVSFNVQYSEHIDQAIQLLTGTPELESADVILLQEMDETGVQQIAAALSMCYVYYPASVAPATHKHFGPAILSRWPLADDRKIVLPGRERFQKSERVAVAATIEVAGEPVRVYSVHFATPIGLGPGARRKQALAVLDDAERSCDRVVIGGDLNAHGLGKIFADRGYQWPTRDLGRTSRYADVDHIFARGLDLPADSAAERCAGKIADNLGSSDHKPVWAALALGNSRTP